MSDVILVTVENLKNEILYLREQIKNIEQYGIDNLESFIRYECCPCQTNSVDDPFLKRYSKFPTRRLDVEYRSRKYIDKDGLEYQSVEFRMLS